MGEERERERGREGERQREAERETESKRVFAGFRRVCCRFNFDVLGQAAFLFVLKHARVVCPFVRSQAHMYV